MAGMKRFDTDCQDCPLELSRATCTAVAGVAGKKGRIHFGEVIPAGSQLPRGLAFASTRSTPRQSKNAQTGGSTATVKLLPGAATVHSTPSTAPSTARPREQRHGAMTPTRNHQRR